MIGKKEYTNTIELQLLKKEKASLESKLFKQQQDQQSLKEKVRSLETEKETLTQLISSAENSGEVSKISINEIKLRSNIRDEYEFEEIENLATDIFINSQLQPVLITKDNYLISGHRRFFAIKLLNENPDKLNLDLNLKTIPHFIVTYKIDRNNENISDTELKEIQYSENNERRSIDNFQLSNLFNSYLDQGFEQKYIAEKFKKTKGNISSIVTIKKLDQKLVRFLKEFQIFAWSKSKFLEESIKFSDENKQQYYLNSKGIIGWKPLYQIAKQDSLVNQKKAFLEIYANRLSDTELNSEFFIDTIEMEKDPEKAIIVKSALKQINNLTKSIQSLKHIDSVISKEIMFDIQNLQAKVAKL